MRRLAAGLVALAAMAALAAPAQAADGAVLKVDAKARKALAKSGVTLAGGERRVALGVASGSVGAIARVEFAGSLKLRAGEKRVRIRALDATLSAERSQIRGKIAGTQYTLIHLRGVSEGDYDPLTGEVAVRGAKARWDAGARRVLADALGGRKPPARVGTARIRATVDAAPSPQSEPPVATRPAGAVDVSAAQLTWRARESWVDYLHAAGERGGTAVADGATNGPAQTIPPSTEARVYEFGFPFSSGWFDPATGDAALYFAGTVNFHKLIDPFQIDLDAKNPEVELGGESSRAIFTLVGRRNNSDQQGRRAVAQDLDPSAVTPTATPNPDGSTTYSYERIPGTVPDGPTAWPVAGYYQAGSAWGSATISFTVAGAAR